MAWHGLNSVDWAVRLKPPFWHGFMLFVKVCMSEYVGYIQYHDVLYPDILNAYCKINRVYVYILYCRWSLGLGRNWHPISCSLLFLNLYPESVMPSLRYSNSWRWVNLMKLVQALLVKYVDILIVVLLVSDMSCICNSVDPDQLASEEANWSGSALFAIQIVNLYQPGSSNLIGWQLEVGVAS